MKQDPAIDPGRRPASTATFDQLLNTEEAAALLRIHPKTLQRMARRREIPAIQVGKLWRFSASALLSWQEEKLAG